MSGVAILINVGAQTAAAVRELDAVNTALGNQTTTAEKTAAGFKKMAAPAAVAFTAIAGGALVATKAAEEAAATSAALTEVYASMGYKDLADDAEAYAESLSKTIGVDDDIIKQAQTKLATFGEVTKSADTMARATAAAADLAAAGFGSMDGNAVMLGKALNDPIKGLTSLGKAGVTFTEEQKKAIEQMVKSGDVAGAQAIIFGELEKQVGGVAEASATSSSKMSVAFGEISEAVGTALLPAFEALTPYITAFATWASENSTVLLVVGGVIAGLAGAVLLVNAAMAVWSAVSAVAAVATTAFGVAMTILTSPITLIILAIVALIAIGVLLYKHWDDVSAFLAGVWESIKTKAVEAWEAIKGFFTGAWEAIRDKAVEVWTSVKQWFAETWAAIKLKAEELFDGLKTAVSERITAVLTFAKELPGKVISALGNLTTTLFQKGVDLIMGLVNGYLSIWSTVLTFAGNIGLKIASAIGNLASTLYNKGKDLIQGFIDGIKSMAGQILQAVLNIMPAPVRKLLGSVGLNLTAGTNAQGYSTNALTSGPSARASYTGATIININGAIDPESTARQVESLLRKHSARQGRQPGVVQAVAW
jgi:phage-related protein